MSPPSPDVRLLSPLASTSIKHDSNVAHKIQLHQQDANSPIPQLSLHKLRFFVVALLGIGVTGAGLASFLDGVVIMKDVADPIGTSTTADSKVSTFQAANGFVWAAVGLLLEEYFKIFIAVMLIYFANLKWHPKDDVATNGPTQYKLKTLFWFTPLMMYVLNIGLSSVFIEHKVDRIGRALTNEDLVSPTSLSVESFSSQTTAHGNSVVNTILRAAAVGHVQPFALNPNASCSQVDPKKPPVELNLNNSIRLPKLADLQSTAVTYGFTPRSWNLDAMPYAIEPTTSFKFGYQDDMKDVEVNLKKFLKDSNVEFKTLADLVIQGQTMHGKVTSDSNSFLKYKCLRDRVKSEYTGEMETLDRKPVKSHGQRRLVDSIEDDDDDMLVHRDLEETSSGSGSADVEVVVVNTKVTTCYGAGDYLDAIPDFDLPGNQTGEALLNSIYSIGGLLMENMTIELETVTISPSINLTMMTLDIPYEDNQYYKSVNESICNRTTHEFKNPLYAQLAKTNSEAAKYQRWLCSPNEISFYAPFQQCGESNCVIQDVADALNVNRQIKMAPFMTNCDVAARTYDASSLAWYPAHCEESSDQELFLYGVGTYFTGNFDQTDPELGGRVTNPRRHYKITFAKLDFEFEDLSKRFTDAKCIGEDGKTSEDACYGMIHPLQNVKKQDAKDKDVKPRVLVVSQVQVLDDITGPMGDISIRDPLTLVMLRDPKFYDLDDDVVYFTYEYMDMSLMNTTYNESDTLELDNGYCSLYIDAYLNQVKNNHYYIQDPRQALYTSAVYLLFQNAAVKEVTTSSSSQKVVDLSKPVIGKARMKADREIIEIRYTIPLPSVISTALGVAIIIIYMAIIIKWPRDAVKLTDETNPAAQYADVLIDDSYPENVHTRRLRLADGAIVEMDDYATKKIVFRNTHAPDMPVVME